MPGHDVVTSTCDAGQILLQGQVQARIVDEEVSVGRLPNRGTEPIEV
jgi:hypothetical protein